MSAPPISQENWTIGRLLEWTAGYFQRLNLEAPRLDAEVLLAHVLTCGRIDLYTMYDGNVDANDRAKLRELVRQRAEGCPVAYLVGSKEFYQLSFAVDQTVLIPRPETEHVVVEALAFARQRPVQRFLDMGVGSGALAVTLSQEWPEAQGVAVDISPAALTTARRNAEKHGVAGRLAFVESDLFDRLPASEPFDLIVSNPPYVGTEELASLPPDVVRYEPRTALDGGAGGLVVVGRLVQQAAQFLRPGGALLLEIGARQEPAVRQLFGSQTGFELAPTIRDFAGHPRVISARRRSI